MKSKGLFIFTFCFTTIILSAQNISVGLRDNQYAYFQYVSKINIFAKMEQSGFTTNLKYQYIRGYLGYKKDFNWLRGCISGYYGVAYDNSFQNYGLQIFVEKDIGKSFGMEFLLNPHQDSDIKYTTSYGVGAHYFVFREVAIDFLITNVPEYRECINRMKPGILFKSGNLYVKPQISIPLEGRIKNSRVLCSFDYKF